MARWRVKCQLANPKEATVPRAAAKLHTFSDLDIVHCLHEIDMNCQDPRALPAAEVLRVVAERNGGWITGSAAITDPRRVVSSPRTERSRDSTPDLPEFEVYVGRHVSRRRHNEGSFLVHIIH